MDTKTVKIFTFNDLPRLHFVAEIILGDILGLSWEIVTDKRKLGKNPVINYSDEDIKGSFKILPHGLLSENGVKKHEPVVNDWRGLPVFFLTPEGSDLPFDIFAASFFLVSRYEEYLPFKPDEFGRFPASQSFAFKNNFLGRPVIDLWAKELTRSMLQRFRNMTFKRNEFRSLLTIDVDQPYAYRGKDLFRSLGGLIRDISNNRGKAGERYRTVTRGEKDPYDVFDYIFEMFGKSGTDVNVFIPTGNHSSFDKNPSWQSETYRTLIRDMAQRYRVGLHPSFLASDNLSTLSMEKKRLEGIVSQDVITSRFHFIRMRFPQSCRNLVEAGIKEDYSMGYPDEPGFRSGIARAHYFYDIDGEKKTLLKLFPFQIMDGTLYKYKGMTPEESEGVIAGLINETKKVGGLFISIWHNTSLLDNDEWRKWRNTFELMLKLQKQ